MRFIILFIIVFAASPSPAQMEASVWDFGTFKVDFASGQPHIDSSCGAGDDWTEFHSTLSDPKTGKEILAIGQLGIQGDLYLWPSTQLYSDCNPVSNGLLDSGFAVRSTPTWRFGPFPIVGLPGSKDSFLILSIWRPYNGVLADNPRAQIFGVRASLVRVVDGRPEVIKKDIPIAQNVWDFTLAHHANGRDLWLICRDLPNDSLECFRISPAGIDHTPIAGAIRTSLGLDWLWNGGLRVSRSSHLLSIFDGTTESIFKFDARHGTILERVNLPLPPTSWHASEFSPNDSLLYSWEYPGFVQYSLSSFDSTSIQNSRVTLADSSSFGTSVRDSGFYFAVPIIGPDSALYFGFATRHESSSDQRQWMSAVRYPDKRGSACNLDWHHLPIPSIADWMLSGVDVSWEPTLVRDPRGDEHTIEYDLTPVDPRQGLWRFDAWPDSKAKAWIWETGGMRVGTGRSVQTTFAMPGSYATQLVVEYGDYRDTMEHQLLVPSVEQGPIAPKIPTTYQTSTGSEIMVPLAIDMSQFHPMDTMSSMTVAYHLSYDTSRLSLADTDVERCVVLPNGYTVLDARTDSAGLYVRFAKTTLELWSDSINIGTIRFKPISEGSIPISLDYLLYENRWKGTAFCPPSGLSIFAAIMALNASVALAQESTPCTATMHHGLLTLTSGSSAGFQYNICDVLGRSLASGGCTSNELSLRLALPSGSYFVRFDSPAKSGSVRLIVN